MHLKHSFRFLQTFQSTAHEQTLQIPLPQAEKPDDSRLRGQFCYQLEPQEGSLLPSSALSPYLGTSSALRMRSGQRCYMQVQIHLDQTNLPSNAELQSNPFHPAKKKHIEKRQ